MGDRGTLTPQRVARATRTVVLESRARLARVRHAGDDAFCPCCGTWQTSFRDLVMTDRQCRVCRSLERHRLISLLFALRPFLLRPGATVLHIAPERMLGAQLKASASRYVSGDLHGEFGPERLDVLELPFDRDAFDIVVCNHVLEHVPDDARAMRELRRVLRPGGWAMLLVPDVREPSTAESPEVTDPDERLRLYGQADHVRRYGWDYLDRLCDAGFETEVIRLAGVLPEETIRTCRLVKAGEVEPLFLAR
jgi:SAM-dependent methyltransferase